ERDANTNFVCALAERVRHHAVDAYCGEHKRNRRKNSQKLESETPVGQRPGDDLIHGADTVHRDVGIDFFHLASHGFTKTSRVASAAKKNYRVDWRKLPHRNVNMGHA